MKKNLLTPDQIEDVKKYGTLEAPAENTTKSVDNKMPDVDTVHAWVKKDIESSIYLMSFVVHRYPEVLRALAEEIYNKAMKEEQGPAVNHITPKIDA